MFTEVRATLSKVAQLKITLRKLLTAIFSPELIVAATMIAVGWALVAFPQAGSAMYVMQIAAHSGLSPNLYSFIMMICGVFISHVKSSSKFVLLTSPLVFYIVFSMAYYLNNATVTLPVPLIIFAGYYGLLLSLYFLRKKAEEDGSTTKV